MITIILDNSSGHYQAVIDGKAKAGGSTPSEALRALAETLDGQDAKAAAAALAASDAAAQEAALVK